MTRSQGSLALGSIALLLSTTATFADVTAPQVWDDWQAMLTASGEVAVTTGGKSYENGVLTITDMAFSAESDGVTTRGNLPQLVLSENGDGSVTVTMSPEQTLDISGTDSDGAPFSVGLVIEQTDSVTQVTGSPGALSYAFTAPRMGVRIGQVTSDTGDTATGGMVLGNVTGTMQRSVDGSLSTLDYQFAAERGDLKFSLRDSEMGNTVDANGSIADMRSQAHMTVPEGVDPDDAAAIFAAGFAVDATSNVGAVEMSFAVTDSGSDGQVAIRMDGAGSHVAVAQESFAYDMSMNGLALDATMPDMPFPVSFSAGELGIGLTMPLAPTPGPAPYAARLSLAQVTVGDDIWDMLDPGRVIPRDPTTLSVDLSGTATLTQDLFSMSEDMDAPPGLPNSLDINTVDLAFGGASAHVNGAFTFDTSDLTTFDGVPRPQGSLTATISGINALMQKLGQIGLVPPEQAMGVTMMLGMFAVPSGDDQMTSTIEITPEGQITANGMAMPF
ncbi:MAG: DUF2125 domain-containing protein [Rubellimicrobium sp.]|nr:DUF2125 domain-containing protein [Rubellimicrobium sp.]